MIVPDFDNIIIFIHISSKFIIFLLIIFLDLSRNKIYRFLGILLQDNM